MVGSAPSNPSAALPAPSRISPGMSYFYLSLLTMIYVISFIDRKLPFILIESIKRDLSLSDTQIGLLTGVAFSLVFAIAGVPISRLAERYGRKATISSCLFAWSLLTAAGGLAQNFFHLLGARMGVAIGEAGATPAAHSLLADYFPKKRAMALAVFSMGQPMGILIGLALGGLILDMAGWRTAMFVLGLPGIILAIVTFLALKEPPRAPAGAEKAIGVIGTVRMLLRTSTFRHLAAAGMLFGCATGATATFSPAFLIRTYGQSATDVGLAYGLLVGIAGISGAFISGYLTDRLRARDPRWGLWLVGTLLPFTVPFHILAWHAPSYGWAVSFLAIPELSSVFWAAPTFLAVQLLLPSTLRAVGSAAFLFFSTGIGLSLGPFLAGLISDSLTGVVAGNSLGWSLTILTLLKLWAGLHFFIAAARLRRDIHPEHVG